MMTLLHVNISLISLTISLTMAMSTPAISQVDRTKAPVPSPPPEVTLGKHSSFVLGNGMRVIVVENHKLPTISMQMKFDIEPILQGDKAGYIDLVGDLLASGTRRKKKEEIDQIVDGAGATLLTSSSGFYISGLKKNFEPLMNLAYEITTSATFPPEEFEKGKNRAMSGLESRKDDPDGIADQVANVLTFGKGFPYGEITTEKTLGIVQRKNCYAYYQRSFQPQKGYLVFVGDLTIQEAKQWAGKYFENWKGHEYTTSINEGGLEVVDGLGEIRPIVKKPKPYKVRRIAIVDRPGSSQSVIRVLFPVELAPNAEDAMSATVMSNILGGGVFNARLMQNLREDKAYTYGARCSLNTDKYLGRFIASASVRTEVTDSAVTEFMYEIEHMREMDVTPEELEIAKNFLEGSFARSLEDPQTIASFVLNTYLYDLPKGHYETYLKRLDAVTAADVRIAAEKYLYPDNAVVLVIGDKEKVGNKLMPLSFERQVVQYDINGDPYREMAEAPPAGMTAQMVIDAYIKAIGGKGKLLGVKDISQRMTASLGGMAIEMNTWHADPSKYAMEMRAGSQLLQKVVFDGLKGIRTDGDGITENVDLDVEELALDARMFPELYYQESTTGARLILSGTLELDGKQAYKVSIFTANGNALTDYYDVKSGLKLRRTEIQMTREGNLNVINDYKDYREVDGILFPHLVQQKSAMNLSFLVEKIEVNKGVDANRFNVE